MHGFSRIERTMSHSAPGPRRRLLHEHAAVAKRAPPRILGNVQQQRGRSAKPLLAASLQRIDLGSHRRERGELGRTVFFSGNSPCSS